MKFCGRSKKICPASFRQPCHWLKFSRNALPAQSRVRPRVGFLPLACGPACLGMALLPLACGPACLGMALLPLACGPACLGTAFPVQYTGPSGLAIWQRKLGLLKQVTPEE